jgi:hypothetical protein
LEGNYNAHFASDVSAHVFMEKPIIIIIIIIIIIVIIIVIIIIIIIIQVLGQRPVPVQNFNF